MAGCLAWQRVSNKSNVLLHVADEFALYEAFVVRKEPARGIDTQATSTLMKSWFRTSLDLGCVSPPRFLLRTVMKHDTVSQKLTSDKVKFSLCRF